MKKFYTLPLLLFCFFTYAQNELPRQFLTTQAPRSLNAPNTKPAAACTADTILYPYQKELTLSTADSFFLDAMVGNVRTASQAYINSGNVLVKGVQFWGGAYTTNPQQPQTLQVQVSLWNVDAQYMPVTEIATGTVTVTGDHQFYTALFATPVAVSGDYAVSVRSVPNDTLAVVTNNAGSPYNPVNYGEGLGWRKFGSGTWNSAASFFGQDLEYMIFPVVELSITGDFTMNSIAETGVPHSFTNTSAGHLASRVYNLNVFDQYWNLAGADSSYAWSFGDGNIARTKNATHIYNTAGHYNVHLTANLRGYSRNCQDIVAKPLQVAAPGSLNITDTLFYPYYKELELSPADSFFVDAMVGNVRTASQAYVNNGSLDVWGVHFWGAAYTTDPQYQQALQVQVSVWSVDGQYMPIAELAATTVNVTSDYRFYTAFFTSPVTVTGNYAVLVRSVPNDTLAVIINNAGSPHNPVNYGEGLAWRKFGSGTWNTTSSFFGQDAEYMIFPVVRYEAEASFTTDGVGATNQQETFTNASAPHYNNRMVNLNVFDKYWDLVPTDTTYLWNYGDGATSYGTTGQHTYTSTGTFQVSLVARLRGYSRNYADTATNTMTISFPLTVRLSLFKGEKQGGTNRLQWTAATEEEMEGYTIERSADGRNFTAIGHVAAQNRNQSRYQWTDAQPLQRSFYRLRMVNKDGSASYSGIVLLSRDKHNFEVFVAANKIVLVSEAAAAYTLQVYAPNGALIGRQVVNATEGQQTIALSWLGKTCRYETQKHCAHTRG